MLLTWKLKETENPQDIPVPSLVPKIGITSGLLQTFLDPQLGLKDSGDKKQVFSSIERYLKKHTHNLQELLYNYNFQNTWIIKGKWLELPRVLESG